METGRKKMKIKSLSLDGEHWTYVTPIQIDNEADLDKVKGGYAAMRWRKEDTKMFFKITEISYDGIHWFKAETEGGCIVEADGIVVTNPNRRRRFSAPVCEKNYPLPLNVPNVPYIP